MNPQDNPLFTAYALGELSADEARELHAILSDIPAAAHELEQIEAVTDALRHGAPLPQERLSHEQRHAVLHPAHLPRRVQPMQPRKSAPRPRSYLWPVVSGVLKAAALVALTGAAFFAGWSLDRRTQTVAQSLPVVTPPAPVAKSSAPPLVVVPTPQPVRAVPQAVKIAEVKSVNEKRPVVVAEPAPVKKEIVVVSLPPPERVKPAVTPDFGFSMPEGRAAFASTTKQAVDRFDLHPALLKALPPKNKKEGGDFASPMLAQPGKEEAKSVARTPDLYIHSWKAEVAPCPWNTAHRLLRIVVQLPADQSAVMTSDAAFPMQVSFDPLNVKQFRMLSERHLAAPDLRSAGTHVLWYEFQPNGIMETPRDRHIANVSLANARFTSKAVGPFDSSKLQVIDRGYSLQNAREDFVFEASVVGFGLLMRGAEQTGGLNHDLVLSLAKQAKGADATGERARFIQLVTEAQRVAGL